MRSRCQSCSLRSRSISSRSIPIIGESPQIERLPREPRGKRLGRRSGSRLRAHDEQERLDVVNAIDGPQGPQRVPELAQGERSRWPGVSSSWRDCLEPPGQAVDFSDLPAGSLSRTASLDLAEGTTGSRSDRTGRRSPAGQAAPWPSLGQHLRRMSGWACRNSFARLNDASPIRHSRRVLARAAQGARKPEADGRRTVREAPDAVMRLTVSSLSCGGSTYM